MQKVYFQRVYADLVAVTDTTDVTVDQYLNFTITAAQSYDSEDNTKTNLTYLWGCPSTNGQFSESCTRSTSTLLVTYNDRVIMGIADPSQSYVYTLSITKNGRTS